MVEILEAVESGIGVCVLGTGATAAVVYAGFRLAGYRLGVTCREAGPFRPGDARSEDELAAEQEYRKTHSRWTAAHLRRETQVKEMEADQMELDAERMAAERRQKQEERVAYLEECRRDRRRKREEAEKASVEQKDPAAEKASVEQKDPAAEKGA